ncbi:unnamed protein product [Rhizoctonia solani]|uniref:Protein kinase domain-containing protein n=1 Tax=Rhizoctonia solani TaxID=456999 RepID=A0A8H3AJL3_9AGAM|nr:unnamed protein product [Rhizoctonia solani]
MMNLCSQASSTRSPLDNQVDGPAAEDVPVPSVVHFDQFPSNHLTQIISEPQATTSDQAIYKQLAPDILKSLTTTIDQAFSEVITSTMICAEIVAILANHGCTDLTASIDESNCSKYPVANGGLGDVFSGRLRDGSSVAIKVIRVYYDQSQSARVYHKRAAREIYAWSKCEHPNVVKLKGLAVFHDCLAMISPWEENGNLLYYLSKHPNADRCHLSTSICAGLVYLHDNNIVHGDLKGANVLISGDGTPMLMDFGNASLKDATLQFTHTTTAPNLSVRWAPPEILNGTSTYTTAGDVYALGMVSPVLSDHIPLLIYQEALTSQVPFADKKDISLPLLITSHKLLPMRPEETIPKGSTHGDTLWAILTSCWSYDPQDRPSARVVWEDMKPIKAETLKATL